MKSATLRSALGKLRRLLLNKGQKDERSVARDDAMKNYSWHQNDIFHLSNQSSVIVENSSCKENFSPYICSDLVPGLITGIKREVRCKSGAIPVAVRVVNGE
jgi:hypothetical protein